MSVEESIFISVGDFSWGSLAGREPRRFNLCQLKSLSDGFQLQDCPKICHKIRLYHLSRICEFPYPCTHRLRRILRRTHNCLIDQPVVGEPLD